MKYYQNGDVLLFKTNHIKGGTLENVDGNVFHKGQQHSHIIEGDFQLFEDRELGNYYVNCLSDCILKHDEHKSITISEGWYQKKICLEYDHFLEESKEVVD